MPRSDKPRRRYIVQRTLGRGAFGTVYLTKQEGTDNLFAVKETYQNVRYKNREADIVKTLKHPNIVKVFQLFYTHKKDGSYLNIVMEYLPTTLHDVIQQYRMSNSKMDEEHIKYYVFQMYRACAYLSRRQVCHRDIKPQNILVDEQRMKIRMCDFGSAKILADGEWNKHYICSRFYRAPELLCESNYYTTAVDTWSLGCVMAEIYLGEPLFAGANTREQLRLIAEILGPLPPSYPENPRLKVKNDLVEGWETVLRENYPSASTEAARFISNVLTYDFERRFDLGSAISHPYMASVLHENNEFQPRDWLDEEREELKLSCPNLFSEAASVKENDNEPTSQFNS